MPGWRHLPERMTLWVVHPTALNRKPRWEQQTARQVVGNRVLGDTSELGVQVPVLPAQGQAPLSPSDIQGDGVGVRPVVYTLTPQNPRGSWKAVGVAGGRG